VYKFNFLHVHQKIVAMITIFTLQVFVQWPAL